MEYPGNSADMYFYYALWTEFLETAIVLRSQLSLPSRHTASFHRLLALTSHANARANVRLSDPRSKSKILRPGVDFEAT